MMNGDNGGKGWSWFKMYTRTLDLRRNQNILDVAPEYEPYFRDLDHIDQNIRESENARLTKT